MNRYYWNQWGRFTSPDPYSGSASLTDSQSWNRYAYSGGDPANATDPSGLDDLPPDGPDGPDPGDPGSPYPDEPPFACDLFGGCNECPSQDLWGGPVGFLPFPPPFGPICFFLPMPGPTPRRYTKSYSLLVTGDCYQVPLNGGPVTRVINYQLAYQDGSTYGNRPYPTNSGIITEHLSDPNVSVTGSTSTSSGPPGTYLDTQSTLLGGPATFYQSFSAKLANGANVGLAIDAFGGWFYELQVKKHSGYVTINGDAGGRVANGKLVPGSYSPCS